MLKRHETTPLIIIAGLLVLAIGAWRLPHAPVTVVNTSPDSLPSKHMVPDILQVTHLASASTQLRSFDKKITDATVARTLYKATLTLPQERSKVKFCTFNPSSTTNDLRFFRDNTLVLHATVVVGGCGSWVRIDGDNHDLSVDDVFLSLLTSSLGVSERELFGVYNDGAAAGHK
jgi:hypothetical protein